MITTDSSVNCKYPLGRSSSRLQVQSTQMNAWVETEWISIKSKLLIFLGFLFHHLPFPPFLIFQFLVLAAPKHPNVMFVFFSATFPILHPSSFLSGGLYAHTQVEILTHSSPIMTSHLFSVSLSSACRLKNFPQHFVSLLFGRWYVLKDVLRSQFCQVLVVPWRVDF